MKPRKVAILLSGGVDSGTAAHLLQKEGFLVSSFFMRLNDSTASRQAEEDARRVAKFLKIPFKVINLVPIFQQKIIENLKRDYAQGKTPNPCVTCNKEIKFGTMLDKALSLGFYYVATGHYVQNKKCGLFKKQHCLFRSLDQKKDQSYFLYNLSQKKLKHILFPLGRYNKTKVRALARKIGLPSASRQESQDICFLAGENIQNFLQKNLQKKLGKIIEQETGKTLGEHQGLYFYTLGQRQGICVGGTGPYYVLQKDFKNNILYVGQKENKLLFSNSFQIQKVNWIADQAPKSFSCEVQVRYNQKPIPAKIYKDKKFYKVILKSPARAVTAGQSAVFYKRNQALGGGIID